MKLLKPTLSVLMIFVLLFSSAITVTAEGSTPDEQEVYTVLGDIDEDDEVCIMDATLLQFHLAELQLLTEQAILRGDTNLDGETDIVDVTHLQHYLAGGDGYFYLGLDIEQAKTAQATDMENMRIAEEARAAEEARLAAEAKAKEEAAAAKYAADFAKAERTRQAMQDYNARLKVIENNSIENQIKNYKRQKGVDISEFNGNVDFNKLKAAGYTFVMIRMGWGSNKYAQDDSYFEQNVKKAEAAGMPWGAYLYSYALNTSAVQSEINHTLRLLKDKKPTMPIAFDIEDDDYKYSNGMPSDKTLHDICLTYLKGIEEAGYYPILYTGYSWLTGALNKKDLTGTYDIWYAQWYTKMEYNTDKVGMWQYGGEVNYLESPYISGLSGMFDKDYCFKNYPVIIPAYGYNNHTALLDKNLASTSASPDDESFMQEDGEAVPPGYNGVMGESFRKNK